MAQEIERRFWIKKITKRLPEIVRKEYIQQGYIEVTSPHRSFRIRISDHQRGALAFKMGSGISRMQEEHTIIEPGLAGWIMDRCDYLLEKMRLHLKGGWELDFYLGALKGLIILEKELPTVQEVEWPDWAEGEEVTDFLNNFLLARLAADLQGPYGEELSSIYQNYFRKVPIIALTGGPCSGKDGVIRIIKEELPDWHFTPEAASFVIYQLGIKPDYSGYGAYKLQETMYRMQDLFETAAADFVIRHKKTGIVTNRGTVDAAAYLKGGPAHYEKLLRTSYQLEYARYDLVICLDIPDREIYEQQFSNNPARNESYEVAAEIGHLTKLVWENHPHFVFIPRTESWEEKVEQVRREIKVFLNS